MENGNRKMDPHQKTIFSGHKDIPKSCPQNFLGGKTSENEDHIFPTLPTYPSRTLAPMRPPTPQRKEIDDQIKNWYFFGRRRGEAEEEMEWEKKTFGCPLAFGGGGGERRRALIIFHRFGARNEKNIFFSAWKEKNSIPEMVVPTKHKKNPFLLLLLLLLFCCPTLTPTGDDCQLFPPLTSSRPSKSPQIRGIGRRRGGIKSQFRLLQSFMFYCTLHTIEYVLCSPVHAQPTTHS